MEVKEIPKKRMNTTEKKPNEGKRITSQQIDIKMHLCLLQFNLDSTTTTAARPASQPTNSP